MTETQKLAEDLCRAAQRGNIQLIEELSHRPDTTSFVNTSSSKFSNMTALHFASCGKPLLIPLLLKMGANLEQRDDDNFTPILHASSQDGSIECVRLLLDAGADVSVLCSMKKNALFYAQGNEEKVRYSVPPHILFDEQLQTKLLEKAIKKTEKQGSDLTSSIRSKTCSIS